METVGIVAAIIFFAVFVGAAILVFSMIRRTVKMAFRLLIVGVLLLIAGTGAFALWHFLGTSDGKKPSAPVQRTR